MKIILFIKGFKLYFNNWLYVLVWLWYCIKLSITPIVVSLTAYCVLSCHSLRTAYCNTHCVLRIVVSLTAYCVLSYRSLRTAYYRITQLMLAVVQKGSYNTIVAGSRFSSAGLSRIEYFTLHLLYFKVRCPSLLSILIMLLHISPPLVCDLRTDGLSVWHDMVSIQPKAWLSWWSRYGALWCSRLDMIPN